MNETKNQLKVRDKDTDKQSTNQQTNRNMQRHKQSKSNKHSVAVFNNGVEIANTMIIVINRRPQTLLCNKNIFRGGCETWLTATFLKLFDLIPSCCLPQWMNTFQVGFVPIELDVEDCRLQWLLDQITGCRVENRNKFSVAGKTAWVQHNWTGTDQTCNVLRFQV